MQSTSKSKRKRKPYVPPQVRKLTLADAKQFLADHGAPEVLEELKEESKERAKKLHKSA
jgi:hypothetical protein